MWNVNKPVKSLKIIFSVIPADAGSGLPRIG